jgi:hypothetical protein
MAYKLALLWPALLLLACPPRTAYADLIIHDPVVGATTATDNGVPVACDPALTIRLSDWVMPDGRVSFSVFGQVGVNGHGPVWTAGVIDGGTWCGWGGCVVGRLGWHNVGGPLGDPSFAGLALGSRAGQSVVVDRTHAATTLTILDPPSIFAYLASWFAGDPSADFNADGAVSVQDFYDYIADYLGG